VGYGRSCLFWVLCATCFIHGTDGRKALLSLERSSSSGRSRRMPAIYAEWSTGITVHSKTVVHNKDNPLGCSQLPRCSKCALVVLQGNCTFARKARLAQAAGFNMLLVAAANDSKTVSMGDSPSRLLGIQLRSPPHIAAAMLPKAYGAKLVRLVGTGQQFAAVLEPNNRFLADLFGEAVMGLVAVLLVMAGAIYSCEDLRYPSDTPVEDDVEPVEEYAGFTFLVYGSIMLTLLYFFMKYGIYLLIFFFVTGAVSSTVALLEPVVARFQPAWRERKAYSLPRRVSSLTGIATEHFCSDVVAEVVAIALAVGFLLNRNNDDVGWIFQDLISVALLLMIQRSVRFPNLKVATVFLICTFFFDIFWVFISPKIFGKSVMIEVATGGGTGQSVPLVLKIPDAYGSFKILGYGDIAIPGLLISLLLRHDLTTRASPCCVYFAAGVTGYALGLIATFISLFLMKHGQPALLFLVPGILIPTFLIALRKGEFTAFWTAAYGPAPPEGYQALPDNADKQA